MKNKILYFLILSLFINCKKEIIKVDKQNKIEQVYAENDYGIFGGTINLKYILTVVTSVKKTKKIQSTRKVKHLMADIKLSLIQ